MEHKTMNWHILKNWQIVALVLLIVILAMILWEIVMIKSEFLLIANTVNTFYSAHKTQNLDLADAQLLSPEQDGNLSADKLWEGMSSNWRYVFRLYLKTELAQNSLRIWPKIKNGHVSLFAVIDGVVCFDSPSSISIKITLSKQNDRWYIVKIEQTGLNLGEYPSLN